MNGGSGVVTPPAAMRRGANQLELVQFGSQWRGLVAGKLAHICRWLAHASCELKFRITGRRPRAAITAIGLPCHRPALHMDVRLRLFAT